MDMRVVEVTLQGRTFALRTEEDPSVVQEVVDLANRRIDEFASGSGNLPPHSVALLAVLALAEELLKERKTLAALRERIRQRSTRIAEMLESPSRAGDGDGPPDGGMGI